ncbi:hypothetical protein IR196_05030 [Brucella anthropi]|uniref:hypothetical protein n=1 Tax=Brucella anthropi TaxID=529 RepID=UPI00188A773A|nr:hypothetical protein [Brucella anthropi]QPA25461.1 hypothetical protein IR196_05030 [Brucella anthropi]
MLEAGLTIEHALIAAEAMEQEIMPARTARQDRNRRYYEKKASEKRLNKTKQDVSDASGVVSPKKETSPTPPKEKTTPSTISEANASSISLETEFEQQFWPIYPRRVGKGQALKAFRSARKQAELETILAGVRRYAEQRRGENPEYTRHASTWLNGQSWLDEADQKFTAHRNEPPPKPRNIGDAIRDEARRLGVLKDEPVSENRGFHDEGHPAGNVRVLDLAFRPSLKGFG